MLQRKEKEGLINEIRELADRNSIVLVVRQNMVTVAEACELRSNIRKAESTYKVSKNTLFGIAFTGTQFESLKDSLSGQTAVVFSNSPAEVCKILYDFAKKSQEKLEVVAGFYNGKLLSASDIQFLSTLPPLDVLRAQFIALIKTPSQRVYNCVKAPAEQIARVLKSYSEKNS